MLILLCIDRGSFCELTVLLVSGFTNSLEWLIIIFPPCSLLFCCNVQSHIVGCDAGTGNSVEMPVYKL